MSAIMIRIPAAEVKKFGGYGFVEDRGPARAALPASNGNYLFNETGVGVQPMALIRLWHEVLAFLSKFPNRGIQNDIQEIPDIYGKVEYYQPDKRFKTLLPAHDFIQSLTEGAMGFVPGNTITDVGGLIADSVGLAKSFRKLKVKKKNLTEDAVMIGFTYLPGKGWEKLGTGHVPFPVILKWVTSRLSSMA